MTLRCRPRGPIRRSNAMWQRQRRLKLWWLWVPACAGTTGAWFVPTMLDRPGSPLARGRTMCGTTPRNYALARRGLHRRRGLPEQNGALLGGADAARVGVDLLGLGVGALDRRPRLDRLE